MTYGLHAGGFPSQELLQFRQGVGIHLGLHRAEFGATHGAKLGGFVDVGGEGFVVVFLGPFGVEG